MKNKLNVKFITFSIALATCILLLIFLSYFIYSAFLNKLFLENYALSIYDKNSTEIFTIDKIVCFSSCDSDATINTNSTVTINNLTQYTDIAIFINNSTNDFSLSNTLKSVSIKDFSFNRKPNLGNYNLYYKSLTNFATFNFSDSDLIDDELNFKISSDDTIDYNEPILFNNCANPITLSYINSNIKEDYTISNPDSSIAYDGSLLKRCNILLSDVNCSFSFTIFIENNLGEKFKCPVYIDIPLEGNSTSIYDGSFTYTYQPNFVFYRYE